MAVRGAELLRTLEHSPPRTVRSWRLNDRHYGMLTGMEKDAAGCCRCGTNGWRLRWCAGSQC